MQPSTCNQQILLNTNSQTHQSQNSPGSPKDSSSAHSPQALSLSPLHSPMSIGSPLSPGRGYMKGESERGQYKEQRRVGHIHAEQKRRYNIKNGFDTLHSLIPQLNQNPNTKLSKAAMLQKGADYIRQLRTERNQMKEEMDNLKKQIECLNTSIRYVWAPQIKETYFHTCFKFMLLNNSRIKKFRFTGISNSCDFIVKFLTYLRHTIYISTRFLRLFSS